MAERDDPQWWQYRWNDIETLAENSISHSRQTETTIWSLSMDLPHHVLKFAMKRVSIIWKRKNQVAILLEPEGRHIIVLDTKLENESMEIRKAILALKLAEAYLHAHPSLKLSREKLVSKWGIPTKALQNDSVVGLMY